MLSKRTEVAACRRELKRLKDAGLHPLWSINGVHGPNSRPKWQAFDIQCDDIDDTPENGVQLLRQQADDAMRPYVEKALEAYRKRLESILRAHGEEP